MSTFSFFAIYFLLMPSTMLEALVHFALFWHQLSNPESQPQPPSAPPKGKPPFRLELGTVLTIEFRLIWCICNVALSGF